MPRRFLALSIVLLLGVWLRVAGLDFGSPSATARPDEEHVLKESLRAVDGDWVARFHAYPSGLPRLQAVTFLVLQRAGLLPTDGSARKAWERDPMPWHLAARALSAVAGILTILVVGLAGRRAGGAVAGVAAAAFWALAPMAVLHGHFATVDGPGTLAVALVLALVAAPRPSRRAIMTAALFAGVACGIKYTMAVSLMLPLIALIGRPHAWRWGLAGTMAFLVGAVMTSPPIISDGSAVWAALSAEAGGQATRRGATGLVAAAQHLLVGGLLAGCTLPLLALGSAGLARRWLAPLFVIFGLHAAVGVPFVRYLLPALPLLAVAAGITLSRILSRTPAGLDVLFLVVVFALPLWRDLEIRASLSRRDTRGELVQAFRDGRLPEGLPIFAPVWPFEAWPPGDARLVRYTPEHGVADLVDLVQGEGVLIVLAETDAIFSGPASLAWVSGTRARIDAMVRTGTLTRDIVLVLDPRLGEPADYEAHDFFFTPLGRPLAQERPGPRIEVWRLGPPSR
ncbi:MAG: glycosyltransferase family 39 protein [Planctomycetes bacterium]|nr:glycosyltransferase family 39 protein [Planctomycetota bacterium]